MKFIITMIFLLACGLVASAGNKNHATKSKTTIALPGPTDPIAYLNRALQEELMSNTDIRYCYTKTDWGRERKPTKMAIDIQVDSGGRVTERHFNAKLSSEANAEISGCLIDVMSALIIPFKSSERGKTLTALFTFPVKTGKHPK